MNRLLVSLFIVTMLLVACGGSPAASTPTPPDPPTVAPVAPPPSTAPTVAPTALPVPTAAVPAPVPAASGSAKEAIIAAMRASLTAGPFRTQSTIVSDSGPINMTGELIPPDKLHTTMQATDFAMETIVIGDQAWTKQDGVWALSPVSGQVFLQSAFAAQTVEELDKTISDAQALGIETVNGEQTFVYSFTSTTDLGGTGVVISAVKLWTSAKSGLPVKQEIAGEAGGVKSTTVQTIEYDATLIIEPPL